MKALFNELNRRAVSDGWVRVSNDFGTVAARFTAGRLTAFYYRTRRTQ